jgi:hypothetical protein
VTVGEAPEIVLMIKDSISGGAESIALRIEADAMDRSSKRSIAARLPTITF